MHCTYAIDGVSLSQGDRWDLLAETKMPAAAGRRVAMLDLPFVDGSIGVRQGMDVGTVGLTLLLTGSHAEQNLNRSILSRIIVEGRTLRWTPDGSEGFETSILRADVSEPDWTDTDTTLSAVLTVAPFWREVGEPRESTSVVLGLPLTLDALAGTSGDSQDAILAISGSFSTARAVGLDGSAVLLNQPVPEGRVLLVDVAGWRAWTVGLSDLLSASSSSGWPTTGSPYRLEFPPQGRLRIGPLAGRTPVLQTSGTNIGPYSFVTVKSGRWFL